MPSKPERPEPAVGQVWMTSDGEHYLISDVCGEEFRLIYSWDLFRAIGTAAEDDTYVGQFDGFKVKEAT